MKATIKQMLSTVISKFNSTTIETNRPNLLDYLSRIDFPGIIETGRKGILFGSAYLYYNRLNRAFWM